MVCDRILNEIRNFLKAGGEDLLILISASLLLIYGVFIWILTLFKKRKVTILAYAVFPLVLVALLSSTILLEGRHLSKVLFIAISLLIFSLILFLPPLVSYKKRCLKKEEKELIEFIDREISRASETEENSNRELLKEEKALEREKSVDFSHVKSVIKRLSYYPLSVQEKKQVKELEKSILIIESGEDNENFIKDVNDYLTALLKIMAKYGV